MNTFKQLNATDTITTPFVVNKAFLFSGSNNFTGSNIGIDIFVGTIPTQSVFNPDSSATTGYVSTQYEELIYSSIRQLYYSNYYNQSYGDNASTASIIPNDFYITSSDDPTQPIDNTGEFLNETGNIQFNITGPRLTTNYYNYLSNTLTASRTLSNLSSADPDNPIGLGVISIPSNLFGEYIKPGTFKTTITTGSFEFIITDDGLGNLFFNNNSFEQAGNIIYEHGLAVLTFPTVTSSSINIKPRTYVKRKI